MVKGDFGHVRNRRLGHRTLRTVLNLVRRPFQSGRDGVAFPRRSVREIPTSVPAADAASFGQLGMHMVRCPPHGASDP